MRFLSFIIPLAAAAAAQAQAQAPPPPPPPPLVSTWSAAPCTYSGARNCAFGLDGPVLGNGDVGAMLGVSSASNVSFYITKNDFWCLACGVQPACRYGTYNNTLHYPPMQLDTGCVYPASGDRNSQGLAGGLTLSPVGDATASWTAAQFFGNATVAARFALASGRGALETLSFVAAPADAATTATYSLLATQLSTTAASLDVDCEVYAGAPRAGGASGGGGKNETWGAWVLPTESAPPIGLRAGLNTSVAIVMRIVGGTPLGGQRVRLAAGETAWCVAVVLSSVDNAERSPLGAAQAAALALTDASLRATLAAHVAWWAAYWAQSSVSLPGFPEVESFWVAQQYLMGSAVRFGVGPGRGPYKTAPALGSAWLVGGEHNGFTLDYNAEAQFYGVASSNRAASVLPFARVVLDFLGNARNESAFFQCPGGLHFPGAIGPFGYVNGSLLPQSGAMRTQPAHRIGTANRTIRIPSLLPLVPLYLSLIHSRYYNFNWMHMLSHGSFAALPLVWHWEYTRDTSFLMDATIASADPSATPYALFKGLATWWLCHLVKDADGVYQDLDDCAYEDTNYYTRVDNHPQDQNLCNATAYSGRLDVNDTSPILRNPAISLGFLAKVLRTAIDASAALGVDADLRPQWQDRLDHLAPFPTAVVPDPFGGAEGANITVLTAQEHPLYWPGQLNPLAFYALWPSEELGLGSDPALLATAERTVRTMGAMGSWSQNNAFPESFPAAVRAGVNASFILGNMTAVIKATMAPGGMLNEGQECSGAVQAVNDMLVSSYGSPPVLRLFAVWPRMQDASFVNLRAKGAFLLTGAIVAGAVEPVYLSSEKGSTVTMQTPWATGLKVSVVGTGAPVPVKQDPGTAFFYFDTVAGGSYKIEQNA